MSSTAAATASVITTRQLTKRYGALEVLRGIDLDAHEGEVISILGASGFGKSTFLRCLNLLEIPTSGSLTVLDENIRFREQGNEQRIADQKQVNRSRSQVGMVFQNFCLWNHKTVLQNVMEAPIHVQGRN